MNKEFTDRELEFIVMALFERKHILLEELYYLHSNKEARKNINTAYHMATKLMTRLMSRMSKLAVERIELCEQKVADDWITKKNCIIENFINIYIGDDLKC